MLDLFNLPTSLGKADIQVITRTGNGGMHHYSVPRGKSMLYIYCLGSGGGGGGGASGSAGTARGGGGGGAGSSASTLLVPISLLPKSLFIVVGAPSFGGTAGNPGGFGNISSVRVSPYTSAAADVSNVLIVSGGLTGGTAPTQGTGSGAGAGGVAEAAATAALMPLGGLGIWQSIIGNNGTAGGVHTGASGAAIAIPTSGISAMGGTGGGGVTAADQAGGAITAVTSSLISESRPINASAGSNNGSGGFKLKDLMFNYPGMGGGSSNAGVGGNGGDGGFGCGGGGGGGGTTGGTGGTGGAGLVVMIAW
jgi:hypothetical protein